MSDSSNKSRQERSDAKLTDANELDPFEIAFLPEFEHGRGPREPFVNEFGVVIGDHEYESAASPLNNWSTDTDPEVMAGEQWVHPFKDIGFLSSENREYFEQGIEPSENGNGGKFMHPDKDVAYGAYREPQKADETNSVSN